jgi:hypothetical protein
MGVLDFLFTVFFFSLCFSNFARIRISLLIVYFLVVNLNEFIRNMNLNTFVFALFIESLVNHSKVSI